MSFYLNWEDVPETADTPNGLSFYSFDKKIDFNNLNTNVFISGDNYPVLRLLENELSGKIDFIYIDPPYNTGKTSFVYNDSLYSKKSGKDKHSAWLSFMSRRLNCAKKCLSEKGCIFIAIGQEELYHLKLLCDEIFGEENFINDFMWLHGKGKKNSFSRTMQQSNLCYAKNINELKPFVDFEITDWATKNIDNDERGAWFSGSISFSESRSSSSHRNYYEITSPSGKKWLRQWFVSKEEMNVLINENRIYWGEAPEYSNVPRIKVFNGEKKEIIPPNIIESKSTRDAQNYVDGLLAEKGVFDNPKPVELIQRLISITNMPDDITVMDFFAGSGTTIEAVYRKNQEDGGHRKCILVQKPEEIKSKESKFKTISDLCFERASLVLRNSNEDIVRINLLDDRNL